MRTSRVVGLLLLATATLAQQQQTVEITSEPSHHLVFENRYVRVFDVTVAPKATTLVHRHAYDYLFVTLGDADLINARVGEKPVALKLSDGEVRYTAGNFAHAATNQSDQPFHNITIELLKPSGKVGPCAGICDVKQCAQAGEHCPVVTRRIVADQWQVSVVRMPPSSRLEKHTHSLPHLVIAVSDLDLNSQSDAGSAVVTEKPGGLAWVPSGVTHTLLNNSSKPAQFVTVEFKSQEPKQ